jgi:hypothetical protein
MAFDAAQGEQWNERSNDNAGREQDRPIDGRGCSEDGALLPTQSVRGTGFHGQRFGSGIHPACQTLEDALHLITVASTMSPKSMAPTLRRLADSPRRTMIPTAKNSANGMVAPTITALRRLPRNSHWLQQGRFTWPPN